jgi:hypothetical protein
MRNISQFAISMVLLASQVHIPALGDSTASAESQAPAAGVYEVKLNTNTASPVEIVAPTKPNFDTDVLAPLRADQAAEAAKAAQALAAAQAAKRKAQIIAEEAVARVVIPTNDVWGALRDCEAGGDYTRNSGNGYYGAYQYSLSTWADFMGYVRPDLAPPAVQDAKAHATEAARGWAPWPACARKLGLL